MCGIAGFSGDFDEVLLHRMNAAQANRGPDGTGTYHDASNGIGLAHVRLAILDLSPAGLQPMWSEDRSLAIIFNGEIYNFRELRTELERAGHVFRTQTDTEVLLAGYREYGPDLLSRLNGMFAFAIWDVQRRELFLARDAFGVKPLYYATTERGFVFASQLRTLLVEPSVSRQLDNRALPFLLTYIWNPSPLTILAAVKKLEAGQAMIVREGRIARTWHYTQEEHDPGVYGQTEEVEERLRHLLDQAVSRQLITDAPLGAFLSGGLDSTAIVAHAQRHSAAGEPLRCFTMGEGPGRGFVADLPYARIAAKALGVALEIVNPEPNWAECFPSTISALDEPMADPAVLNVEWICRSAQQQGLKVLLSGVGGDDLFSGYRRHLALAFEQRWAWTPQIARRLARRAATLLPKRDPTLRRLHKALQFAHLPDEERLISYFYWTDPAEVRALTGTNVDVALPLKEALQDLPREASPLGKMLHLERKFFLVDHNLNYTDKAAMKYGVEVRVPFLDPDLVRFAAGVPDSLKIRGGEPKWIFKKAMEGLLPSEIIWRPKTGFGAPLADWLRGPLRPWLVEQLHAPALEGLVSKPEALKVLHRLDQHEDSAAYTLFVLAATSSWLSSLER